MRSLELRFTGTDSPELYETLFSDQVSGEERRCIRGRDNGAYPGHDNFQLTRSVLALAIFFLRAAALGGDCGKRSFMPLLLGDSCTPASSLDYALDKQPIWLLDMFGCDLKGASVAKHIIRRTNPGRKWAGPVALSLNRNFLSEENIRILFNNRIIEDRESLLRLAARLETTFGGLGKKASWGPSCHTDSFRQAGNG